MPIYTGGLETLELEPEAVDPVPAIPEAAEPPKSKNKESSLPRTLEDHLADLNLEAFYMSMNFSCTEDSDLAEFERMNANICTDAVVGLSYSVCSRIESSFSKWADNFLAEYVIELTKKYALTNPLLIHDVQDFFLEIFQQGSVQEILKGVETAMDKYHGEMQSYFNKHVCVTPAKFENQHEEAKSNAARSLYRNCGRCVFDRGTSFFKIQYEKWNTQTKEFEREVSDFAYISVPKVELDAFVLSKLEKFQDLGPACMVEKMVESVMKVKTVNSGVSELVKKSVANCREKMAVCSARTKSKLWKRLLKILKEETASFRKILKVGSPYANVDRLIRTLRLHTFLEYERHILPEYQNKWTNRKSRKHAVTNESEPMEGITVAHCSSSITACAPGTGRKRGRKRKLLIGTAELSNVEIEKEKKQTQPQEILNKKFAMPVGTLAAIPPEVPATPVRPLPVDLAALFRSPLNTGNENQDFSPVPTVYPMSDSEAEASRSVKKTKIRRGPGSVASNQLFQSSVPPVSPPVENRAKDSDGFRVPMPSESLFSRNGKIRPPAERMAAPIPTTSHMLAIHFGMDCVRYGAWIENKEVFIVNEFDRVTTPSIISIVDSEVLIGEQVSEKICADYPETTWTFRDLLCKPLPSRKVYLKDFEVGTSRELIIALFLQTIQRNFEICYEASCSRLVIAIPFWFTIGQRQSVKDAAFIAGFTETHLITEPTCAAVQIATMEQEEKVDVNTMIILVLDKSHYSLASYQYVCGNVNMTGNNIGELAWISRPSNMTLGNTAYCGLGKGLVDLIKSSFRSDEENYGKHLRIVRSVADNESEYLQTAETVVKNAFPELEVSTQAVILSGALVYTEKLLAVENPELPLYLFCEKSPYDLKLIQGDQNQMLTLFEKWEPLGIQKWHLRTHEFDSIIEPTSITLVEPSDYMDKIFETGEVKINPKEVGTKSFFKLKVFKSFEGQILLELEEATETSKTVAGVKINIRGKYERVGIRFVRAHLPSSRIKLLADFLNDLKVNTC